MNANPARPAVIVVNSLVARGAVGGRASLFALERSGFPVWFVTTIALPWHPGHGRATRIVPDAGTFAAFLADLGASRRLSEVGAILSGYLGDAVQAEPVARLVDAVRAVNPSALYLCDPVIGDHYGMFQPEPIAAAIRDQLLPRADIVTPNRYEFAWLSGTSPPDNAGLIAAARHPGREVVVTSAFAADDEIGNLAVTPEDAVLVAHPKLTDVPHGTGDLMAALYLGHRLDAMAPRAALERAASVTFRLAMLAREQGADELPLAGGQALLGESVEGVRIEPLIGHDR